MLVLDILDALFLGILSFECLRILQACSYKPKRGYFKIFASKYFAFNVIVQVLCLLCFYLLQRWCVTICLAVASILTFFVKRKCPLKFTKRIVRILFVQVAVLFCACHFVCSAYFVILLPVIALASCAICLPADLLIAKYYLKKAVQRLSQSGITVIAITGSYGKTSTKDMLTTLLDGAIAPTGSCNTPLGIANFINKTDFSQYKFLILEFGARQIGDIRELCTLYKPKYGIITGICEQHLSTFKTLGNIVKTKGELVEFLPSDGVCVFNSDNQLVNNFLQLGRCKKVLTNSRLISNVNTNLHGISFELGGENQNYIVNLPQISHYIIDTFLTCFEMCNLLGQDVDLTVKNCSKIQQTSHRMQIVHNGSFYIVDDAYNANIKGVESCCETLAKFDNYKIVLTQGIVEGGRKQRQFNEQCGKMLGVTFDVVIAIGKYAKHISTGAKQGKSQVVVAKSLFEATKLLRNYTKPNCIVVFQNDLPDVISL